METTGLKWNEKKCAAIHMKRGQGGAAMKITDLKFIKSLDQYYAYKFLGVLENTKQADKQVPEQRHTYRGYQSSAPAHCQIMQR